MSFKNGCVRFSNILQRAFMELTKLLTGLYKRSIKPIDLQGGKQRSLCIDASGSLSEIAGD